MIRAILIDEEMCYRADGNYQYGDFNYATVFEIENTEGKLIITPELPKDNRWKIIPIKLGVI